MTEQEIKDDINKFKEEQLEWARESFKDEGSITPTMTILAFDKTKDKMGLVVAPIIGDFEQDSSLRKEDFIKKVIPDLFEQVEKQGLKAYCFSFASEIYIRTANIENKDEMNTAAKDWRDLKAQEGLLITFEDDYENRVEIYTVNKKGMVITPEGKMIDDVELVPFEVDDTTALIPTDEITNVFKRYAR